MNAALARKELRALLPFLVIVLLVWGGDFLFVPLTTHPDRQPMSKGFDLVKSDGEIGLMTFLLAFSLAAGLLVGEHDRGTVEFLDSLPVSRLRVFAVKVGIALAVLWIGPLLGVLEACVFHALSRDSLDPGFHPRILGAALFLHVVQAFVCVAWGLLFSFLRRLAWILAALSYLALGTLIGIDPAFGLFDPRALTPPVFEGQRWVVPWRLLGVQGGLAATALLFAGWLFVGAGDRMLRGLAHLRQSRWGRSLLAATALAGLGAWAFLIGREMDREPAAPTERPQPLSSVTTDAYVITFPAGLADRAAVLARAADGIHDRVRHFFAADPVGRITVNGAGIRASARAEGLASWKTIRLDLPGTANTDALQATLGHETVHVYAAALSEDRLKTPFLSEGLAEYLEHRLFRPSYDARRARLVAAILHARQQARFEELMDAEGLRRRQDPDDVYPLGAAFVAALVERHGDAAPGKVLRALGRKQAPTHLTGLALWHDAFQEAGYDLDGVVDGFYARLEADVARWRELIDRLPRLRASVSTRGDVVAIEPRPSRDLGEAQVRCRFRSTLDAPREAWWHATLEDDTFWVQATAFPGGVLHYQLGLLDGEVGQVIWEPWTTVPLGR